ncbi:MAG: HAMP domain-containing histidine kinase [Desulfamplus sp.]|nr:HAMP domain-containing histidine kinase [Desulfamplus sp.]
MNGQIEGLGNAGLNYFGSMSASIAHEIKNALAITNENAGLMEDLSLMAIKSGQPLDPERISRLSGKIMDQIKRADSIVKKMSRFAHSVDDPVKQIDLAEILELTLDLGRRSAQAYGVTLEPVKYDVPVSVQTNPFMFMNLLWLVVKSACKRVNSDKKLELALSKDQQVVKITIINLESLDQAKQTQQKDEASIRQEEEIVNIASFLNITVDMAQDKKIILTLP